MKLIPETHQDLITPEKKAFLYLATLNADGSPQVTPVWFSTEGDTILINSTKGRIKDRNMRRRAQVALCIADPTNPYRYLQIQGRVIETTEKGAPEHIDTLAGKYTGIAKYTFGAAGEIRVTYKIQPEKVDAH